MSNACVKFEECSLNPSKVIALTTKLWCGGGRGGRRRGGGVADENIIFPETCVSREYNNTHFAGIGIVINVAGCLVRGRRRWSVTYASPRGLGLRSSEFRIWNRRAFQERKRDQFPGRMKDSLYYIAPTSRLHNKQGVPHPTRSVIGRRAFTLHPSSDKRQT